MKEMQEKKKQEEERKKKEIKEEKKKVTEEFVKLISKDGKEFVVPVRILKHCPTFARMLDNTFKESKMVFSQ